jgi:NAD-dependent dihydropyrimidine dehydrogenase PreA subunit
MQGGLTMSKKNKYSLDRLRIVTQLISLGVFFILFRNNALQNWIVFVGTAFSLSGKVSKYGLQVDKEKCISCGKCEEICTNNTIIVDENKKREIINNDCLLCFKCAEACPTKVINYQKL